MTIRELNLQDAITASQALAVQQAGYQVEADLIGFAAIPPLLETLGDLQASQELFYGYFVEETLAGFIAYEPIPNGIDITRMVVHPAYFRRGIARQLITHVMALATPQALITVSTGALNTPARRFYEGQGFELVEIITLPAGVQIARYCHHKP